MDQNAKGNVEQYIVIDLNPAIKIIKSYQSFYEHRSWYQAVLMNIIDTVLEEDHVESRGDKGDSFAAAEDIIASHFNNKDAGFSIANQILDYMIQEVLIHIPDLEHPKYKHRLETQYINETLVIIILNEPRESIFER